MHTNVRTYARAHTYVQTNFMYVRTKVAYSVLTNIRSLHAKVRAYERIQHTFPGITKT